MIFLPKSKKDQIQSSFPLKTDMMPGKFKNSGLAFKRNKQKKEPEEREAMVSEGPRSQLSGMLDNSFKSFKSM